MIAGTDSGNSLRFILLDEATIHGNINCAVENKDVGLLSHDLKLLRVRLDEKDGKIGKQKQRVSPVKKPVEILNNLDHNCHEEIS